MIKRELRSYEISVWSLQDDFLIVLKSAEKEKKNQIQNPDFVVDVDGTQELTFSIPMYLNENGIKSENWLWHNYKDGLILANLRKIKLILNKQTEKEEVFELLITKVIEEHKNNQLVCSVTCEGLAFQELGKTGYNLCLSSEQFQNESLNWFENGANESEPKATLQYWCESSNNGLGLKPIPTDGSRLNPAEWYYDIQMDWSAYTKQSNSGIIARDIHKVYEDEYVSSWSLTNNKELYPKKIEAYKEKERLVDLEESNKYNLTQDLAEKFGVYCKYVYEHDDQYHITARKIIFYNNFMVENEGTIDINYKYNTASIKRTLDSTDTITKMFVRPVNGEGEFDENITIMDVDANKSRENYILNFDYLHDIGAIDDALYNEVPKYEAAMYDYNLQIDEYANQLIKLQEELPQIQAKKTFALNAMNLDQERLNAANDVLNALVKSGETADTIEVTANNPATAILLQRANGIYYIKISVAGIRTETIHIYKTINFSSVVSRLTDEITNSSFIYDEFNNLIEIEFPLLEILENDSRIVYLIYNYVPQLQYERVAQIWTQRLIQDTEDFSNYETREAELIDTINLVSNQYEEVLNNKKTSIASFEKLMGAALREGYWQPEDYKDYGDMFLDTLNLTLNWSNIKINGESGYTQFKWDTESFDEEQKLYYMFSAENKKVYYLCIRLTASIIPLIQNKLDNLSILYYDYKSELYNDYQPKYRQALTFKSNMQLAFVNKLGSAEIIPVLLITGAEKLSDTSLKFLTCQEEYELGASALGKLYVDTEDVNNNIKEDIYYGQQIIDDNGSPELTGEKINWLALDDTYTAVYPRININSLELKTSSDQLSIKYKNTNLTNYEDYTLLTRASDNLYCLTIKPEIFVNNYDATDEGIWEIQIKFTLSNANTAIYLDALQVLKDSAYPQVEYEVEVQTIDIDLIQTVSNLLSRICCINDWELHFNNVYGYVSQFKMSLDKPSDDKLVIKNYKTKFEDLFKKIVAQVEQMQKAQYSTALVSQAIMADGTLSKDTIQQSINRIDLNYAFNNGNLSISETDGIFCSSDDGIVAIRGSGIFTATQQDEFGNWQWNTGILPQGINADLITTGQLDTNLIRIYAGDKLAFQWNANGLYAYKAISSDPELIAAATNNTAIANVLNEASKNKNIDTAQYVVHNEDGLFLIADQGALVLNANKNGFKELTNQVKRVEISWDGLKLRNWNNQITFFADSDTGDLSIAGTFVTNEDLFNYNNANAFLNADIAGVKISKQGIWLATKNTGNTQRNVILMDNDGIVLKTSNDIYTNDIILSPTEFRLGPDNSNNSALQGPLLEYTYNIDNNTPSLNIGATTHIGGEDGWTIGTWTKNIDDIGIVNGASIYSGIIDIEGHSLQFQIGENNDNDDINNVNGIYLGTDGITLTGNVQFNININKTIIDDETNKNMKFKIDANGAEFDTLQVKNLSVENLDTAQLNQIYSGPKTFVIKEQYDYNYNLTDVQPPTDILETWYCPDTNQVYDSITAISDQQSAIIWDMDNPRDYITSLQTVFNSFENQVINDDIIIGIDDDIIENLTLKNVSGSGSITIISGNPNTVMIGGKKISGVLTLINNSIKIIIGAEDLGLEIVANSNIQKGIIIQQCNDVSLLFNKIQGPSGNDTIACYINHSDVCFEGNELFNAGCLIELQNLSHMNFIDNYGINEQTTIAIKSHNSIILFGTKISGQTSPTYRPKGQIELINTLTNMNNYDAISQYWYDNNPPGQIVPADSESNNTITITSTVTGYTYNSSRTYDNASFITGGYLQETLNNDIWKQYEGYAQFDLSALAGKTLTSVILILKRKVLANSTETYTRIYGLFSENKNNSKNGSKEWFYKPQFYFYNFKINQIYNLTSNDLTAALQTYINNKSSNKLKISYLTLLPPGHSMTYEGEESWRISLVEGSSNYAAYSQYNDNTPPTLIVTYK